MIFCFSGTGNSRYAAGLLSRRLGMEVVNINHLTISLPATTGDELNVWVFPIHSWGLPRPVVEFIGKVRASAASRHYMVCTCGDDIGLAHRQWRRLVEKRGWKACSAYSVQMPNTYVVFPGFDVDSDEVERSKLAAVPGRVDSIADRIVDGDMADDVAKGGFAWIKSKVVYPYFMRHMTSPKPFHVDTSKCISCGRCRSVCPMANVSMSDDSHPRWGDDCVMCLGCYHVCPVHAVGYGSITARKGQYFCPEKS